MERIKLFMFITMFFKTKGIDMTSADGNANLTLITWAHAVNSQALLNKALTSDVNMLEADVQIGKVNGTGPTIPIMAHPPDVVSDISLIDFLEKVKSFNAKQTDAGKMKGVKLDFKSIEAFEMSIEDSAISDILNGVVYPIWLNADILRGPLASDSVKPVDPNRFLSGSKGFTKAVLSLGWTTGYKVFEKISYTDEQIEEMLKVIKSNNVTADVTFAVRAGHVAQSLEQMEELTKTDNYTLTVWSGKTDFNIDVDSLSEVIKNITVAKTYLDVPDGLKKRLHLG